MGFIPDQADWRPATDAAADIDLPATDDFALAPTRKNRTDLSESLARRYQRARGLFVRIEEAHAENAKAPFRIDFMTRINAKADGHSANTAGSIYDLIQAYISNLITNGPVAIEIGDIVKGVISANYAGEGRAQMAAWKPGGLFAWRNLVPITLFGEHLGDFEEWASDWSLTLGGDNFAEQATGGNRTNSARAAPPVGDPHICIRERSGWVNKEDREGPLPLNTDGIS